MVNQFWNVVGKLITLRAINASDLARRSTYVIIQIGRKLVYGKWSIQNWGLHFAGTLAVQNSSLLMTRGHQSKLYGGGESLIQFSDIKLCSDNADTQLSDSVLHEIKIVCVLFFLLRIINISMTVFMQLVSALFLLSQPHLIWTRAYNLLHLPLICPSISQGSQVQIFVSWIKVVQSILI